MSESDKYPPQSGRRRFVKGVVGSASLAGVGTVGAASVDLLTNPTGAGGGQTTFYGIENTDGPAPRAMPMIPIEIDADGYVKGIYPEVREVTRQGRTFLVAEQELGGTTYRAEWFQYCGVQGYAGLDPEYDAGDNYFRYSTSPPYDWQSEEVSAGDRVNINDFQDYETWGNNIGQSGMGKPAVATWRSEGAENTIPVQVLRSPITERKAPQSEWLSAATQDGMMAWLNKCTHFCCVPGFKTSTFENADNRVYCQCHQSIYNPFSIVERSFVAFPRPEDD